MARRRMHGHSGGLVDDEQVVVFVDDIKRQRLGGDRQGLDSRNFQLDSLAPAHRSAGLGPRAVQANVSGLDKVPDGAARDGFAVCGQAIGQELIQPPAFGRRWRNQ